MPDIMLRDLTAEQMALLGDAAAVFEELGAHPYLQRAQRVGER